MHLDPTILRSRMGLRIFGLFVLSAMFPVVILVLFSQGVLERQQDQVVRNQLRRTAKDYGLGLFERLDLAQADLAVLRVDADGAHLARDLFDNLLRKRFRGVELVGGGGAVLWRWGERFTVPAPPRPAAKAVRPNPAVLMPLPANGAGGEIVIARRLGPEAGADWALGLLDADFLWRRGDERVRGVSLCVLDLSGRPLFCPDPALRHPRAAGKARTSEHRRLVASWSLFVGARFQDTQWRILAAASRTGSVTSLGGIRAILVKVSLLTLLVVALFSVYLIRKSFEPLEALMAGIRSLSRNDFSTPVQARGGDEFGDIAAAFNRMSARIQRQLRRLNALSAIDRAILARPERGELVGAILRGTAVAVECDLVAVAIAIREAATFRVYESVASEGQEIRVRVARVQPEGLERLAHGVARPRVEDFPDLLESLRQAGAESILSLPVYLEGHLAALLLCGHTENGAAHEESVAEATEFADRLAVGLGDALREERMRYLAYHDALTDLPNRLLLADRMAQYLAQACRGGGGVAVLYVDLDRFKSVNDSLGHEVGDALLQEMARRLQRSVRTGDTVARLGGDEFVVVVNLVGRRNGGMAVTIAEKILESMAAAGTYRGHEVRLSASIGVALAPADGADPDELLKNADAAMYHAKRGGGNSFQFYSEDLNSQALSRLDLAAALHRAAELGELRLFFQPKLNIETRQVVGVEALLRWQHPQRGFLLPDEFIGIAEESGLIVTLGRWVLFEACRRVAAWHRAGRSELAVSVNISPRQFGQANLVELVRDALAASGLPPADLELEITEGAMIQDPRRTLEILRTLRGMGVKVSIDDFGMGYSSLAYLKRFPLDVLKIDKSFVHSMEDEGTDYAIVKAVVVLAHSLGLQVVAEGVNTRGQLLALAALECDQAQGFLCSPPVEEDHLMALLGQGLCDDLA